MGYSNRSGFRGGGDGRANGVLRTDKEKEHNKLEGKDRAFVSCKLSKKDLTVTTISQHYCYFSCYCFTYNPWTRRAPRLLRRN